MGLGRNCGQYRTPPTVRVQVIIETVQPAVVIGLGLIIFSVCIAMFVPLIHILGSADLW